jgi:hypothetical protein
MQADLCDKKVLLAAGSLLSDPDLYAALTGEGAQVTAARSVRTAMQSLTASQIDGAVIDHGLHNEAFDLCVELRERGIPYIYANAPHRLQEEASRRADAARVATKLATVMRAKRRVLGDSMQAVGSRKSKNFQLSLRKEVQHGGGMSGSI